MITLFDVIVLSVILGCALLGYATGIVMVFFLVFSMLGGNWIAQHYAASWGMNAPLLFFLSMVSITVIGYLLHRFLDGYIGQLNRVTGALAGLLLGVILTAAALLPMSRHVSLEYRKAVLSSFTMRRLAPGLEKRFPSVVHLDMARIKGGLFVQPRTMRALEQTFEFNLPVSTSSPAKHRTGG